jgi:hypothetical protein
LNGGNGSASVTERLVSGGRKANAIENRSLSTPTDEPAQPWVSVYDGQRRIGHIVGRGKLNEAFDADHRSIGIFPDQKSAANALSEREGER